MAILECEYPARKHYVRNLAFYALFYCGVVYFSRSFLYGEYTANPWLQFLIAIMPVIPGIFILREMFLHYKSLDEFQQSKISDSVVLAFMIVACISFTYGFIEDFLIFPKIDIAWVFPFMMVTYFVSMLVVNRRYQ